MNNKAFIVLLASVVVLSGCTIPGLPGGGTGPATASSNGIVITKFVPSFTEVRSGQPLTLTLSIQNVGGAIAKDLVSQIFGGISTGTGWSFTSGSATQTLAPTQLRPPDLVNNLPGESLDYSWTVNSPSGLQVTTPYTASVRVSYHYNTSASASMRFYTNSYLQSLPATQYQALVKAAAVQSQTSSAGPLAISFSSGSRPLVLYSSASVSPNPAENFSLQISFNNVGNGNTLDPTVALPSNDPNSLYKVAYTLTTSLSISCPKGDGSGVWPTGNSISDTITLSGGSTKVLYCTVMSPGSAVVNFQDYSVNVQALYGYYVESQATVNVLAAPQ